MSGGGRGGRGRVSLEGREFRGGEEQHGFLPNESPPPSEEKGGEKEEGRGRGRREEGEEKGEKEGGRGRGRREEGTEESNEKVEKVSHT